MAEIVQPQKGFQGVQTSGDVTARGTKIWRKGNELDKNSFLRILTAELSNQDPDNAKDSTQYVAQMAQFASLEQMTNLNGTMTFNSASSLVGKFVNLNILDNNGNRFNGFVRNVVRDGDNIKLSVETGIGANKTIKEFAYKDIYAVVDDRSTGLDENTKFMMASSLMGKTVDAQVLDENNKVVTKTGIVKEVSRGDDCIFMKIQCAESDGTLKEILVPFDYINTVKNV